MRITGSLLAIWSVLVLGVVGFDNSRYDNVVVYWGQNSRGASYPNDTANSQKPISFYCQDNAIDAIPIAFLNKYFSTGGLPEINIGNTCNKGSNGTFPGTSLAKCQNMADDIRACQGNGTSVTLSLGGANGTSVSFTGDDQAQKFADTIWNLFLGGTSNKRPFGDAVLDGINLDIEVGASRGYAAFVSRLRTLATGASKKYYITAAPQCTCSGEVPGGIFNTTLFDAVYVQFYNNPCGLQNFNSTSYWNFGIWDYWARNVSPNKYVKVYVGAPGAAGGADRGYVPISALKSIAVQMRRSYPSFGGVMLWDASQAYANGRYDMGVKNELISAGGVGFKHPACSAPAYTSGRVYTAGDLVSYDGYIWGAKWWTNKVPKHNATGDWNEVSTCQEELLASDPTSSPTGVKYTAVPGIPTGALSNGERTVYKRWCFRNVWHTQVPSVFLYLYLHRRGGIV